jgi:poly(A) polymerase/tRNA nucleotidyltransferase (CCA-adding enzyme)
MQNPETSLQTLSEILTQRGKQGWLVGGSVRDLWLGRQPLDYDIALDADGGPIARALADRMGAAFVNLDATRGVGRVVANLDSPQRLVFDLVQLRAPDIVADLRLRDFSINAMALPLEAMLRPDQTDWKPHLIDPCDGAADLAARRLRAAGSQSLADDPLRILRAVRLAARMDLAIDPALASAMHSHGPRLNEVAAERIREELLSLLALPHAAGWLRFLDAQGVLTIIFPELEAGRDCRQPAAHFLPVLAHMLEAVTCLEWIVAGLEGRPVAAADLPVAVQTYPELAQELPYAGQLAAHIQQPLGIGQCRLSFLKLAVLLHDIAKPETREERADGKITFYQHQEMGADIAREIGRRLRLSRQARSYVETVIRLHMRPGQLRSEPEVSRRAIMRLFRDSGDAGPEVLLHELADHMAVRGPALRPEHWAAHVNWAGQLLDSYWRQPEAAAAPLIDGKQLMAELQLAPGKQLGRLLGEIREAQAAGEIGSSAEALELARAILERERLR